MRSRLLSSTYSKTFVKYLILVLGSTILTNYFHAQTPHIADCQHYSKVFNEIRNYRIVLPPLYDQHIEKKYPVIYYYHGWSQRYFGSTGWGYDDPDSMNMQKIIDFVSSNDVIVVRPDGFDRKTGEKYSPRPYNIGDTSNVTHRQFPLYFPELIDHIDRFYRTIPGKQFRAIAGFSMGGFMAYWIGAKYPDKVCAVGNFCGSAEFFVGPPGLQVEYNHKHMYNNYNGMKVRLHYGNNDFIRAYHENINRTWDHVMPGYTFQIYESGHISVGLHQMFSFFMDCFSSPVHEPQQWNHIDIYPEFEVWGYNISSNRDIPGFTALNNVSEQGFSINARRYLPDGELLRHVKFNVTTPPLYKKNAIYIIHEVDKFLWKTSSKDIKSDDEGRITFNLDGSDHWIGINEKGSRHLMVKLVSFETSEGIYALHGNETNMKIKLFNAGLNPINEIQVKIRPFIPDDVEVLQEKTNISEILACTLKEASSSLSFRVLNKNADMVRLIATIVDGENRCRNETIDIPVIHAGTYTEDFQIADGMLVPVFTGGIKKKTVFCGFGNGDGKPNPGELIVVLFKDGDAYRRARIYSNDVNINPHGMSFRKSESWEDWDNTGASNKFSELLISSECHENTEIPCYCSYQFPTETDLHERKYHQIQIKVKGRDKTPPWIQWFKVTGDNLIRVKLVDGGDIKNVSVKLIPIKFPQSERVFELNDQGNQGDQIIGDMVFTTSIPRSGFNLCHFEINAVDIYGNEMKSIMNETYFLQ